MDEFTCITSGQNKSSTRRLNYSTAWTYIISGYMHARLFMDGADSRLYQQEKFSD